MATVVKKSDTKKVTQKVNTPFESVNHTPDDDQTVVTVTATEEVSTSADVSEADINDTSGNSGVSVLQNVSTESTVPETVEQPKKRVRIRPKRNHSCSIGGERYNLKKDVIVSVPEGVKDILKKAGILSPL